MELDEAKTAKATDEDRGPGYAWAMGVGFIGQPGKFGGLGGAGCWIKLSGAYRVAKDKPLSSVAP